MAFLGNLEDLPFSDVVQLLHVSKKSGTLLIETPESQAKIVFREGFIVAASHPSKEVNLEQILVRSKKVTSAQMNEAQALVGGSDELQVPVLVILRDLGYLSKEQGWAALRELIHRTMAEVIAWKSGAFNFAVSSLEFDHEFKHFPEEMATWSGVDSQGALVEAFRVFDERNRDLQEKKRRQVDREARAEARIDALASDLEETEEETPVDFAGQEATSLAESIEELPQDSSDSQIAHRERVVVFLCNDSFVKHSMHRICKDSKMTAFFSAVEKDLGDVIDAGLAGGQSIVLVADLADTASRELGPRRRVSVVERMRRKYPELPFVILSSSFGVKAYHKMFELGARTMIPKPEQGEEKEKYVESMKSFLDILMACLVSVFDEDHELRNRALQSRMEMASLKKRVHEIQDRKTSPDISLIILQYIAEYLERGIIFLVRKKDLLGLGSFGMDQKGDTISTAAMRLRIPLIEGSVFQEVINKGIVFRGESDDQVLREYLQEHIGAPESNEVLLLPLKTENKTVALVYCDFGKQESAQQVRTDALEILASQAGMAMEIALQRTRRESLIADSPTVAKK